MIIKKYFKNKIILFSVLLSVFFLAFVQNSFSMDRETDGDHDKTLFAIYNNDEISAHFVTVYQGDSDSSGSQGDFEIETNSIQSHDDSWPTESEPLVRQIPAKKPQFIPLKSGDQMNVMYFKDHNHSDIPALLKYTLHKNRSGIAWDNNARFMYETDREFFNEPRSWKILAAGFVGGLIGAAMPATPATGLTLWGIGDTLEISVDGVFSNLLTTQIMLTMTPVFARQFYERGQTIMRCLTGANNFVPGKEGDNKPHRFKPGWDHTALKFVVGAGALVQGMYFFGLAYVAEEQFPYVAWIMGPALGAAFAERYYTIGIHSLDRLYIQYACDSKIVHDQRSILVGQARRALIEIEKNDRLVSNIYHTVREEIDSNSTGIDQEGSDHFFALSTLLLRHMVSGRDKLEKKDTLDTDGKSSLYSREGSSSSSHDTDENQKLRKKIDELTKENDEYASDHLKLQAFKALVDRMTPSTKEDLLGYLNIMLTGASDFGRLLSQQYILENIFQVVLGFDPETANTMAWGIGGFQVVLENALEYQVQQNYAKRWLNMFSLKHLVDFQGVRKGIGWLSLLNGGWFALSSILPALEKLRTMSMPIPLQFLTVVPGFLIEQGNVQSYCDENLNEIVTATATLQGRNVKNIIQQRAMCHNWVKNVIKLIEVADTETIMVLFNKTQRAL